MQKSVIAMLAICLIAGSATSSFFNFFEHKTVAPDHVSNTTADSNTNATPAANTEQTNESTKAVETHADGNMGTNSNSARISDVLSSTVPVIAEAKPEAVKEIPNATYSDVTSSGNNTTSEQRMPIRTSGPMGVPVGIMRQTISGPFGFEETTNQGNNLTDAVNNDVTQNPTTDVPATNPSVNPTPTQPTQPTNPTPVNPTPTNPTPVDPTPTNPTPVDPTPTNPTPVDPTPTNPTPVDPTPTEPTNPTPVDPTPVDPTPTEPTNPGTVDPTPTPGTGDNTNPPVTDPNPDVPTIPTNPDLGNPSEPVTPTPEPVEPTDPTIPTIPTNPTDPTIPTIPTNPTDPTVPTIPTIPSNPIIPSGQQVLYPTILPGYYYNPATNWYFFDPAYVKMNYMLPQNNNNQNTGATNGEMYNSIDALLNQASNTGAPTLAGANPANVAALLDNSNLETIKALLDEVNKAAINAYQAQGN